MWHLAKAAEWYLEKYNVSVIPCAADKRPAIKWEGFQDQPATVNEARQWSAPNIGIVTGAISGIIVVDCDDLDDARWFWWQGGKLASVIVRTPRGIHFYYQTPGEPVANGQKIGGRKIDVRGDGGFVVAPPSVIGGKRYEFLPTHRMRQAVEMTPFRMEWRYPKGTPQRQATMHKAFDAKQTIRDGIAYIRTIRAVAGQGGHNETYKAVCKLKESGLGEADALAAMIDWNQSNCEPPWSMAELLHKVKSVYGGAR